MDFGRLGGGLVRLLGKRMMKEPTLVIAGTRDFFYPEPILRETAERIPDATLRLYDGVGHPVGKTHKRRFENDVLGFLGG
jgi:pimeloyl-ACP methyl ester carboxylesterase